MARRRGGAQPKTSAGVLGCKRTVPADEIEEIEARRIGERTQLVHLGQDQVADCVQP